MIMARKTKQRTRTDKESAVKFWRFEIVKLPPEAKSRWQTLQSRCQEAVNMWWQLWLADHIAAGDHLAIRNWMTQVKACRQAGKKPPNCPIAPMAACPVSIGRRISAEFDDIHSGTLDLLLNIQSKRLLGKDAEGKYRLWQAVLACRQGQPSYERRLPVPFRARQCGPFIKLRSGLHKESRHPGSLYEFTINLERKKVPGRALKQAITETLVILVRGRGSELKIIDRIRDGTYTPKGSSVYYDKGKRKWFVLIGYSMPAMARPQQGTATAVLHASKLDQVAFRLRVCGAAKRTGKGVDFSTRRGGRGLHLGAIRQRVLTGRWVRQEAYTWSGARARHGRVKVLGPIGPLRDRWRNTVTSYIRKLSSDLAAECLGNGIGKLVYFKPSGARRSSRWLSRTGKVHGRVDSTGFDWHKVKAELARKCAEANIVFVCKDSPREPATSSAGGKSKKIDRSRNHRHRPSGAGRKRVAIAVTTKHKR